MKGVTQLAVRSSTEISVSSLCAMGIGTEHIPQPTHERRQKARHGQDEAEPSTAAPPPPPHQSNSQRLFTRLDDIEYRLGWMDTHLERIEYHLGIPPPQYGNEGEVDD